MRAALVVVALAVLAGCGSPSADLFVVDRSGPDPAANLTMVARRGSAAETLVVSRLGRVRW